MKESVGNDKFSIKLLDAHNIFAGKTPELSAMRVQSEPLFGGEAALFLVISLSVLMGFLAGALDKEDLNGIGLYVSVFVLLLVAYSSFRKRKLTTTLDASGKSAVLKKAGVFGTALFSSQKEFSQPQIAQIVIERFAKGYFGGFGVQIKTSSGEKIFITNQNLELEDAQNCAEGVREFLNLKEKVVIAG
jgi:hypothetical protein